MKRVIITTTSLVFAGGMAAANPNISISGFAELGVSGSKGSDAKLHKDIDIGFDAMAETDTGLQFGLSIDLDNAAAENKAHGSGDDGKGHTHSNYDAQGNVYIKGAFGKLTLGDTDGAFDAALDEVGKGGAIADNHTSHPGYDGNSGLDGSTGNGGNILRYEYGLGTIVTSVSGEFAAADSSDSAMGVGVNWSGDVGGIGVKVGLGHQTRSSADSSISGASVSVDMGNGISFVVNTSGKDADGTRTTHNAVGVAYTVGDLTIGVNGGQKKHKGAMNQNDSGAGFAAVYSLGSGVDFQVGAGSGKKGDAKESSWSAGLAFSF